MRNLSIWGAVAVLAVLVATVAVFGSADSAKAGVCGDIPVVEVPVEGLGVLAGIADNEYTVTWAGVCTDEGYTLTLKLCNGDTFKACKTVKFDDVSSPFTGAIADMKGLASKGDGDSLTAHVRLQHASMTPNGGHKAGASEPIEVSADAP